MSFQGRTVIVSGGSRGIGEAIAVRLAEEGANIALLAKTVEPHPRLPGTLITAAAHVEEAGGRALPLQVDVRHDSEVEAAVGRIVDTFGGIDVVVNNASAIDLSDIGDLSMARYDLMHDINARGAFLLTKSCVPFLTGADNPHVLTLSPPLRTEPRWFGTHTAYTMSKFAMSVLTLGLSAELAPHGIAVNSLWPRTTIDTAAVRNVVGERLISHSRVPRIVADAARVVLSLPAAEFTGHLLIDDEVLAEAGVTDLDRYLVGDAADDLALDFWVDPVGAHNSLLSLR